MSMNNDVFLSLEVDENCSDPLLRTYARFFEGRLPEIGESVNLICVRKSDDEIAFRLRVISAPPAVGE